MHRQVPYIDLKNVKTRFLEIAREEGKKKRLLEIAQLWHSKRQQQGEQHVSMHAQFILFSGQAAVHFQFLSDLLSQAFDHGKKVCIEINPKIDLEAHVCKSQFDDSTYGIRINPNILGRKGQGIFINLQSLAAVFARIAHEHVHIFQFSKDYEMTMKYFEEQYPEIQRKVQAKQMSPDEYARTPFEKDAYQAMAVFEEALLGLLRDIGFEPEKSLEGLVPFVDSYPRIT